MLVMTHLVCVVSCFLVLVTASYYEPTEASNYELPCLSFGGICIHKDECPQGNESKIKGLCPMQKKNGVECCHGLPKSETRCHNKGGECMPKTYRCPNKLTFSEATDCSKDEKCCILVN